MPLGTYKEIAMIRRVLQLSALLMTVSISSFAQNADDILAQVDKKLMPESYGSYGQLTDIEPSGNKKEYTVYIAKKGTDTMVMLFLTPASDKDRAVLRIGDNMWLYIPSVGKPIRQTSLQSVTGGIFNNSDILSLDFSAEYGASILLEDEREYVLDLRARSRSVAYDHVKMWVIKTGLIVEKIECYSAGGMLLKILEFTQIKDFGGWVARPSVVETTSPLYSGYRSIMTYLQIAVREFPDEIFTLPYMPKLKGILR
jgi:outer membrane lipoprotein-sorting protein